MTFHRFLELSANLVQYWKNADYTKMAIFSKIMLLNLTLNGREVAKISLKKPFSDEEEGWFVLIGVQRGTKLEHSFKLIWDWLCDDKNEERIVEILQMEDLCKPIEKLKYPIQKDIVNISGTK